MDLYVLASGSGYATNSIYIGTRQKCFDKMKELVCEAMKENCFRPETIDEVKSRTLDDDILETQGGVICSEAVFSSNYAWVDGDLRYDFDIIPYEENVKLL